MRLYGSTLALSPLSVGKTYNNAIDAMKPFLHIAAAGREPQISTYPRQTRKATLTLQAMPSGLSRYHDTWHLHFITFSCYHRQQKLGWQMLGMSSSNR